jgi:thiol-disulfide isomerase/thioredoxin
MTTKHQGFSTSLGAALLTSVLLVVPAASMQAQASSQGQIQTSQTHNLFPQLMGKTINKKSFQLASLKGKVVLLMYWSTDCPVCRDQMPELRENVRGWAGQPFELVLVNVDKRMEDVERYNTIINASVPVKQRFTQLWMGDASFQDDLGTAQIQRSQLPVTFLLDKNGKLLERNNGRIPSAWWDNIADLL